MVALLLLSVALFFASIGLAVRLQFPKRAESALVAMLLGSALLLVPVYGLGLTGQLYRGRLIAASAVVFLGALACSFIKTNARAHLKAILSASLSFWRLPIDGLRATWRERGLALVGAVSVLLIVVWSGVASYAASSDGWDGLGYHEPMIGYTIQDHGMIRPAVVQRIVFFEAINGNPRHCEMTALWMVMMVDRRLIELPNTFAAPMFLLAVYLLCRRFGVDVASSIGWACAAILMPGAILILRSTYIDLHVAAFSMSAVYLCTRPGFRVRDAWPSAVAVGLMLGAKVTNLAWAPPVGMMAMVLLGVHLVRGTQHRGKILAVMAGALALAAVLGGVLYVRNKVMFGSPIWPFGLEIKSLHINFPGLQSGADAAKEQHKPIADVWKAIVSPYKPGADYPDTRVFGYGMSVPFLLLPMGVIALVMALVDATRAILARLKQAPLEDEAVIVSFLVVLLYGLACGVFSPAIWQARYNLHVAAILVIACARLGAYASTLRLGTGAMAVTVLSNLAYLYWAEPGLQPGPKQLYQLLKLPAVERAARKMDHWTIDDDVARAREAHLKPGDLLVYTDSFLFIGTMWNEQYSNRIEWWPVAEPKDMMAAFDKRGAKWVVTGTFSPLATALSADKRWRRVGRMDQAATAYERASQ
ncbi:MAG: hypothetical protein HY898_21840 [Deltaproteobacteria bacterium]|nr:hypothetical protein [Deltaproteobacteria bacterium]